MFLPKKKDALSLKQKRGSLGLEEVLFGEYYS